MKIFIDTANLADIQKALELGIVTGVTTNPSLIAKEGLDYYTTLKKIASMTDGPVFGEVKATATLAEDIIKEAREIYAIAPKNMVVKIPMNTEGLKAISALKKEGIPTNCTLIFSANQALLAALAGASYVSLFVGRLDDIGQKGTDVVSEVVDIFANYPDIHCEVLAASIRTPMHVTDCAIAGADVATIPYNVIMQMAKHPLTESGIERFKNDYIKVFGE
ncbi:MAG: fructose-6-phosphate aldolase [Clostridiales bacterium]|nr:fructose-6-phosphate aldolase [Clostridiales bacterium]